MQCSRCGEAVEASAAYCGNCGVALMREQQADSLPPAVPFQPPTSIERAVPAYAVASPSQHVAETKAMISVVIAVLAVPGSVIPLLGWLLAAGAIVSGSILRPKLARKTLGNVAISLGVMAVLLSGAVFAYNARQYQRQVQLADRQNSLSNSGRQNAGGTATSSGLIKTPCYSLLTKDHPYVDASADSCKSRAYDGSSQATVSDVLSVEASSQAEISEANLATAGREIAGTYLKTSMPDVVISSQNTATFAGSPAYIISGKRSNGASIQMALVSRKVTHGENVFIITHISQGNADVLRFESNWAWN